MQELAYLGSSTLYSVIIDEKTGYSEIWPENDDSSPPSDMRVVYHGLTSFRQAERVRARVEDGWYQENWHRIES